MIYSGALWKVKPLGLIISVEFTWCNGPTSSSRVFFGLSFPGMKSGALPILVAQNGGPRICQPFVRLDCMKSKRGVVPNLTINSVFHKDLFPLAQLLHKAFLFPRIIDSKSLWRSSNPTPCPWHPREKTVQPWFEISRDGAPTALGDHVFHWRTQESPPDFEFGSLQLGSCLTLGFSGC